MSQRRNANIIGFALLASLQCIALCVHALEENPSIDLAVEWLTSTVQEVEQRAGDPEFRSEGFQGGFIDHSTIFAPSDKAFMDLAHILGVEVEDLASLDSEPKGPIRQTLAYHVVVDRKLLLETIPEGESALMTASSMKPATRDGGKLLKVIKKDGKVVLEGGGKGSRAHIITPDIEWNSNIVHVIDAVLLPEGLDAFAQEDHHHECGHNRK